MQHTAHCTLHTTHCTVHTSHCTQHTAHNTLHTTHGVKALHTTHGVKALSSHNGRATVPHSATRSNSSRIWMICRTNLGRSTEKLSESSSQPCPLLLLISSSCLDLYSCLAIPWPARPCPAPLASPCLDERKIRLRPPSPGEGVLGGAGGSAGPAGVLLTPWDPQPGGIIPHLLFVPLLQPPVFPPCVSTPGLSLPGFRARCKN